MPLLKLEHYLNSDKRILLAEEVSRLAKIYKDNFDKLSFACTNINMNASGHTHSNMNDIALVFEATHLIENNLPTNELLPEAIETAKSLLSLDIAKKNFSDDGVPYVLSLELTRKVLDIDITGSKEIVYTYNN
jgi:hypothetical protein